MDSQNIRIRLKAFDHRVLDQSTSEIVTLPSGPARRSRADSAADSDREVHVLRSPHIDKKSREQFEIRTHKRCSTSSIRRADGGRPDEARPRRRRRRRDQVEELGWQRCEPD